MRMDSRVVLVAGLLSASCLFLIVQHHIHGRSGERYSLRSEIQSRPTKCFGSMCLQPWGQVVPLSGTDAYVFKGMAKFEKVLVINITESSKEYVVVLNPRWNLHLTLRIKDNPQTAAFEDWSHKSSDNTFILKATNGSTLHDLKDVMHQEIANFCRHPMPKRYILSMTPYPDRQSSVVLSSCFTGEGRCGPVETSERRMFQRTINGPCANSAPTTLEEDKNAFYCTTNSPLVTDIFGEHLSDTYVDQGDERCDKARRICQQCLLMACRVKHVDWNMRFPATSPPSGLNDSCCQLRCYPTPHCQQYFSRRCYPLDRYKVNGTRLCFRGKTLKFTLTPDFELIEKTFECHIKRREPFKPHSMQIELGFHFTTLARTNRVATRSAHVGGLFHSSSYLLKLNTRLLHRRVKRLLGDQLTIQYQDNIPDIREAVLLKQIGSSVSEDKFFLKAIHSQQQGDLENRRIGFARHRDQKYVEFRNKKPFHFNTDNWHRQGCYLKLADAILPDSISPKRTGKEDPHSPVKVRISPPRIPGEPFAYVINELHRHRQIQLSARGDHKSLLRAVFCEQSEFSAESPQPPLVHTLLRDPKHPITLHLTNIPRADEQHANSALRQRLILNGCVSGTPVYFGVKFGLRFNDAATNNSDYELTDRDIVIFPSSSGNQEEPQRFSLGFDIDASTDDSYFVYIHLIDCLGVQTLQYLVQFAPVNKNHPPLRTHHANHLSMMLIDADGLHARLPFLLLSVLLVSLYLVLFVAFLLLCLCRPKRRRFVLPSLLFQGPGCSRASTLSSAAKSSTATLLGTDTSPYSSPAHENAGGFISNGLRLSTAENIPISRKILIFLYVCFRAFTIFLFTFSVGLSVILSIESESFKMLMSSVQNAKGAQIRELASQEAIRKTLSIHGRRPTTWLQDLRQLERATDSELARQTSYFTHQVSTCEIQEMQASSDVGLAMSDVAAHVLTANEMENSANVANIPLNFLQYQAVVNASWEFIDIQHWKPYNNSLEGYMDMSKSQLDNKMFRHWVPYTKLLFQMIENPWLAAARRAMNSSNEAFSHPEIGRFNGRPSTALVGLTPANQSEVEMLTFAEFLGIAQPTNARYAEARMWNSLRQLIAPLRGLESVDPGGPSGHGDLLNPSHPPYGALREPLQFFTRKEFFTTEDLDILPSSAASTAHRNLLYQRGLHGSTRAIRKQDGFMLRDWINITYLRVYLLILDAYIIISLFYSACRNFCALWLGKRRRLYHNTRHRNQKAPRKRPFHGLSNGDLLLTNNDPENPKDSEVLIPPTMPILESNQPDLIQTVIQARSSVSPNNNQLNSPLSNQRSQATTMHTSDIQMRHSGHGNGVNTVLSNVDTSSKPRETPLLSDDPGAADFNGFNQRGSLPACCCCLDFHYLFVLFGVCLIILGLVITMGAGRGFGNNWLLKRSALVSRVEAMDTYRRQTRAMVHHVQLNYLNSGRLLLERRKAKSQLARLKRIQQWLHHEKDHLLRQNLYEVCALSEPTGLSHSAYYAVDSSICHRIRQEQQLRRQRSPYGQQHRTKPPASILPPAFSQDRLKLPLCAFLPVQSQDIMNASFSNRDRHTILDTEKVSTLLSEQELRQLHQMIFKNSSFATFLTSVYRLLFTTILLSMCTCWLLACKYLVVQMASRTVSVMTSRVTVLSSHTPASRRMETFFHSSNSSLSFHRPSSAGPMQGIFLSPDGGHIDGDHPNDLPMHDAFFRPPQAPPHADATALKKRTSVPQHVESKSKKKQKKRKQQKLGQSKQQLQNDSSESRV